MMPAVRYILRLLWKRSGLWGRVLGIWCFSGAIEALAAGLSFNRDIRPILAENCLQCHGPDAASKKSKVRLDLEADAKKRVIDLKRPAESELLRRITSTDSSIVMPPPDSGKKLKPEEITKLKMWMSQGARYETHWAFEPISRRRAFGGRSNFDTTIDAYIEAALKQQNLTLSPSVSPSQWLRRVTFDLTGLPPTWSEIQDFEADSSLRAPERVVDRLLASPRYGERWGRHWLDLARYADTHGGSAIGFTRFPFSYTYRDYVVRAFNQDLPYDRFVLEQIAADQMGLTENDPSLAALGFLTVGLQYRNRHDVIDDQIDVITRGLQGLTVSCARCHDHKFDPVSTEDYYGLYAALAGSESPKLLPIIGKPEPRPDLVDYQAELARRIALHDDIAAEHNQVMRGRLRMQVGFYLREIAKGTPEYDTSTAFLSYRTDDIRPDVYNRWRSYLLKMPEADPVFGLWVKTTKFGTNEFQSKVEALVKELQKENGDPAKFKDQHRLDSMAPKWNPKVLEAVALKTPKSMLELADAYGELFTQVHRSWLKALQTASAEAEPGGQIIPDEDTKQVEINSAVLRQLRRHLFGANTPTAISEDLAVELLNRTVHDNLAGRRGAIHELHLNAAGSPPRAMALIENASPEPYHVLLRGNPLSRGPSVPPRFLSVLSSTPLKTFPDGKRRLGLAQAIADPANPLTRRVIVNWIWQHHFGQGLVRTPDDWGTRGSFPVHMDLLDDLAETFKEDGWSLKKLHRRIVLSRTYAQSAVENAHARNIDPDNTLLWRMPRRRLELEAMLDSMLFVSGELDTSLGGRPFDRQSQPQSRRRSLYAFVNRDVVSPLSSTFDAANPSACTAKRSETTVPQQTLFALNSEFIQDRAVALAELVSRAYPDDKKARLIELYRRLLSREPTPAELDRVLRFEKESGSEPPIRAWQQIAHALLASNEFAFID